VLDLWRAARPNDPLEVDHVVPRSAPTRSNDRTLKAAAQENSDRESLTSWSFATSAMGWHCSKSVRLRAFNRVGDLVTYPKHAVVRQARVTGGQNLGPSASSSRRRAGAKPGLTLDEFLNGHDAWPFLRRPPLRPTLRVTRTAIGACTRSNTAATERKPRSRLAPSVSPQTRSARVETFQPIKVFAGNASAGSSCPTAPLELNRLLLRAPGALGLCGSAICFLRPRVRLQLNNGSNFGKRLAEPNRPEKGKAPFRAPSPVAGGGI
jgi:hypothetical protein